MFTQMRERDRVFLFHFFNHVPHEVRAFFSHDVFYDVILGFMIWSSLSKLHGVHTDTVDFSPTVLIKCGICSYSHSLTRTVPGWLKKAMHEKWSHLSTRQFRKKKVVCSKRSKTLSYAQLQLFKNISESS